MSRLIAVIAHGLVKLWVLFAQSFILLVYEGIEILVYQSLLVHLVAIPCAGSMSWFPVGEWAGWLLAHQNSLALSGDGKSVGRTRFGFAMDETVLAQCRSFQVLKHFVETRGLAETLLLVYFLVVELPLLFALEAKTERLLVDLLC